MAKDTIFLDPKKFKHVKSDKHTTTLRHADGHELTIAHSAVTPSMQKALSALGGSAETAQTPLQADEAHDQKYADGGEVDEYGYPIKKPQDHPRLDAIQPKPTSTPKPKDNSIYNGYAKGGKVEQKPKAQPQEPRQKPVVKKHEDPRFGNTTVVDNEDKRIGTVRTKFASGGMTEDPDAKDSITNALDALDDGQPRQQEDFSLNRFSPGSIVNSVLPTSPAIDTDAKPQYLAEANDLAHDGLSPQRDVVADQANQPMPPPGQLASAELPADTAVSAPAASPSEEVAQQPPQAQDSTQPHGMPDMAGLINRGYSDAMAGADLKAKAEAQWGQADAKIQADAAKASDDARNAFQDSYKETLSELHQHMQDVKEGQIDPDKYWTGDKDGNGSHSRIMTGIGMILAGFNPTSNPNAAIDYVKHQMDKNIEAQSKNLESKQNLVRANLEQFHNLKDATEMSRLQQADVVNHYLDQAAATAKTPMSKAAALMAKSQIAQTYAPLAMQLSLRQTLNKLSASNNPDAIGSALNQMQAMPGGAEMAKPYVERYVPGVGMATVPVPGAVRDQITSAQKLQSTAQDLDKYASQHMGSVSPSVRAIAAQKAMAVQAMFREGQLGTVYREGEQPLLDRAVSGSPTSFLQFYSTHPKLKEMIAASQRQTDVLKSNYGLPTTKPQAEADPNAQAMAWAQSHPKDPRSAAILKRLGR